MSASQSILARLVSICSYRQVALKMFKYLPAQWRALMMQGFTASNAGDSWSIPTWEDMKDSMPPSEAALRRQALQLLVHDVSRAGDNVPLRTIILKTLLVL
eukprot:TRINITY_DN9319_c2_g1_i1.p1 TRINITY_DN9319_c2_g1~~TRINITY_DN9319_c2_g1_i1.p1  ORF type:complete len:101 (-),score=12.01 TRINITY_DN9319_c2_g1_i1:551-853(-)